MDVTFLESEWFFPSPVSNYTLQEESYGEERNWLDVEILDTSPTYSDRVNNMEEPVSRPELELPRTEAEVVLESPEDEVVDVPLHSLVPNDPSTENTPEVSYPITPLQTNAIDTSVG